MEPAQVLAKPVVLSNLFYYDQNASALTLSDRPHRRPFDLPSSALHSRRSLRRRPAPNPNPWLGLLLPMPRNSSSPGLGAQASYLLIPDRRHRNHPFPLGGVAGFSLNSGPAPRSPANQHPKPFSWPLSGEGQLLHRFSFSASRNSIFSACPQQSSPLRSHQVPPASR